MPKRDASDGIYRYHGNSHVRFLLFVVGKHFGIVHLVDVVAGKNEYVRGVELVDKLDVLIYCVCRALVPLARRFLHVGGQNVHAAVSHVQVPRLTVAYVSVQFQRLVLGEYAHRIYARLGAVGKGKVYYAVLSAKLYGRLCQSFGEYSQTTALTARKNHCNALFLFHAIPPETIWI